MGAMTDEPIIRPEGFQTDPTLASGTFCMLGNDGEWHTFRHATPMAEVFAEITRDDRYPPGSFYDQQQKLAEAWRDFWAVVKADARRLGRRLLRR